VGVCQVYDWIPEDEVWIEAVADGHDRECNLFHELYERTLMKGWETVRYKVKKNGYGLSYDVAH